MSTTRRARLVLAAATLLALALWPAPAHAAEEIGLSPDGASWGPALTLPLFGPEARWVPGDDETRSFQLRNQGPTAASMTIEAFSPGGEPQLKADVIVSVRVDGAPWATLDLGSGPRAVTVAPFAVNRAVPVDVRAVFDPASGNPTQNRVMPLTLRIGLAGDVPTDIGPDDGAVGPDSDRGGLLPGTGVAVAPELLLAALALCVAGALVIARRSSEDPRPGVDR